ncbi:hypothetical protein CF319_g7171 [Tilletia indica]|uniref:Nitronate monooxygenase domain-containing protein n=1 Tax=Tilletia walkeri TaxID=117179 RepID=A0A8X7N9B1_9BASI|nr:hypothetical protein CF327_g1917 [Tilletia walkeri]KAE8219066.1 hypothetical protein CF319_g7171 [Tilletia indica]KAE8230669.1 hypothetical protein CF326_g4326 [Tilletia indica]KAE8268005.1 hypothetical protein A4X09_0g4335 [Tilletia walkeri]
MADSSPQQISTAITKLFKIQHPILLAGMNVAAGPALAAAVTNAGGMGVIGGVGYKPKMLRRVIADLKADLKDKNAPFGVDLLLPQVGGSARKTNYDYTKNQLPELIDIIIEEKAALFVSAVGVPPKEVVDRLHKAGIPVANMIGAPRHAEKAIEAGVDIIIAQGGEGGGHTGHIPTSILLPTVVEMVKGKKSPLTGEDIIVIGAGGIFNGRGLAASITYGAAGAWVGTRFVASEESGAPKRHKEVILKSTHDTDVRTLIYTGRPLRVYKTPYIADWESRPDEIKKLTSQGIIPAVHDIENDDKEGTKMKAAMERWLLGQAAAVIHDIKPAKAIIDEMVTDAAEALRSGNALVVSSSRSSKL